VPEVNDTGGQDVFVHLNLALLSWFSSVIIKA
jgi:hypothetical protein